MEKEFDYTFKKNYPYIETSVLKQKEVNNILSIVQSGRLKHFVRFEGYGVCDYDEDDKQLINTHVTMMDKFNRLKTNVMVFKIFRNDWTKGVYDKLFIFKTNWVKEPTLNFVMHNTKTNMSTHTPEIEYAFDILAQDLMKAFNTLHKKEVFDFYRLKLKSAKNGVFIEGTQEVNYDPIMENYFNAQWDDFDEDISNDN